MIENPVINSPIEGDDSRSHFVQEVLKDFWICCVSREASLLARKDVLTGKGIFGITGDGKEVPQVALARAFQKGDHRSGYYRDQTFMFALGLATVEDFFAQLYADAENDPFSGGRQMNNHFATPYIDKNGNWVNQKEALNISSGISSTGGQMARGLGLAMASKLYRESKDLHDSTPFSDDGNEVCFITIGDASTSEGIFWETVNAAGVMQVPLAISVWDDGYGISVPIEYQTTKSSISAVLEGFRLNEKGEGIDIYNVNGWDYPALCEMYEKGIQKIRETHIPALFHVAELTQPQGHSTSGSHERYKTQDRLEWEREHDCILVMQNWMIDSGIATEEEVTELRDKAKTYVKEKRDKAWNDYLAPVRESTERLQGIYDGILQQTQQKAAVQAIKNALVTMKEPLYYQVVRNAKQMSFTLLNENHTGKEALQVWLSEVKDIAHDRYHTDLYSESPKSALKVPVVPPTYEEDAKKVTGFQVLNAFFDKVLDRNKAIYAFGEDVGHIGDVNQGFAGLQEKYGRERVFDTGIREWSIIGQAIGLSMRGLRPIAEIQYLDYLVYGLVPMTDDLATLRYRSNGQQAAPAIIRTRGHRLEGIWHAGSPMSLILSALRGMYVLVPRNMVQAVGFYNTMLQSDDPVLIVECLNGYRLREALPTNIGEYTVPLGVPEVLATGTDVTLVTYGSCVRVAQEAVEMLKKYNISVELIDVQSLLPFDLEHSIVESLKKTNRIVFMDEDVPGGATAYMLQEVMEKQGGYQYLDAAPKTLTAHDHRPPYGSDGDYFSKPNPDDVFQVVYELMHESNPAQYPI